MLNIIRSPGAPAWRPEDAVGLRDWISSPLGLKTVQMLLSLRPTINSPSVEHTAEVRISQADVRAGYEECLDVLYNLADPKIERTINT